MDAPHTTITLAALDAACSAHLAHSAMGGSDPLTDETLRQMRAAAQASEGSPQPAVSAAQAAAFHAAAEPDPLFDRWWVYAAAVAVGMLLSAGWPMGCAG